jgi:DNA integrity scanning protein DisA with diadenylate cyclase activity
MYVIIETSEGRLLSVLKRDTRPEAEKAVKELIAEYYSDDVAEENKTADEVKAIVERDAGDAWTPDGWEPGSGYVLYASGLAG